MKVLIIGGVAAGATTAARLRRLNKDVEIIVFEKGNYVSYANCGLPYYVSGEIQGKDDLLLMTPQLFYDRFQIDVRVTSEVTAIHPENKSISVYNHMTGETYEENYDQLVIATGSSPIRLPIPGIDHPDIQQLWTIDDFEKIRQKVELENMHTACIIGGGFVGIETAENLKELNVENSFHILNKSDVQEDTIGKFAISNCTYKNNIIIGKLSQSYNIDLIKFNGTSKEEVPIKEDTANDNKTYFFINCSKAQIYIQNRRYSPEELNPKLAIERIEIILNKYLSKDYNVIVLQKADVNYDIKEIENYFRESFVKSVEFHNVSDFKLAEGTKLHNPRIDLDDAAVESWNTYSSDNVESVKIKAKKDKSIAKNPIANIDCNI